MRWSPPQPAACVLLCVLASLFVACGRLGFDAERASSNDAASTPDAAVGPSDEDAGETAGDGDGDGDGDASTPSGDGDAGEDGGTPPLGGDDGGTGVDAGTTGDDAGIGNDDAGPVTPSPYPLPAPVNCQNTGGVLACDDMQGSASGSTIYSRDEAGGTSTSAPGVVTMNTSGVSQRAVLQADIAPRSSGPLYLRFSMYLPSEVEVLGLNIASIGLTATGGDFGLDLNLERDGEVEVYTTGDDVVSDAGSYKVPRDRWTCILLKVEDVDNADSTIHVLVDGVDILTSGSRDTLPPGGVVGAAAGIDWTYEGQGPVTLHMTNFVFTTQHPGGCP